MNRTAVKIAIAFVLGVGVGIAFLIPLRAPTDAPQRESPPLETIADEEPNATNQALVLRIAELESQIDALEVERQLAGVSATPPVEVRAPTRPPNVERSLSMSERVVQLLIDEGFAADRAEWIRSRHDELVAALSSPEMLEREPLYQLRRQIGDAEFERYLRATGIDPVVVIAGVEYSKAAPFGFQPLDRVTSYDGHRVFDQREIQLMETQGTVGQPVIVEIIRDGQPMQMYIQRGSFDAFFYSYPRLPGR